MLSACCLQIEGSARCCEYRTARNRVNGRGRIVLKLAQSLCADGTCATRCARGFTLAKRLEEDRPAFLKLLDGCLDSCQVLDRARTARPRVATDRHGAASLRIADGRHVCRKSARIGLSALSGHRANV